jgi:signal transduction histidine kinase
VTSAPAAPARSALRIGPRLLLVVGLGVVIPVSLLTWAAVRSVQGLTGQVLVERRAIARGLALGAEHAVRGVVEALSAVPAAPGFDLEDADPVPEQEALRRARIHMRLLDGLVLERLDGRPIAHEPESYRAADVHLLSLPEASAVVSSGRPTVTPLVVIGGRPVHVFLVPVRDRTGHVAALLGGVRHAGEGSWTALLSTGPPGAVVDLVDQTGKVVASNVHGRAGRDSERAALIQAWWTRRQVIAEDVPRGDGGHEVMAFAPLSLAPAAVTVRQDDDEVFGAAYALQRRILTVGPLVVLVALLFAWGAAQSVRLPLAVLNRSARRIAEGDLSKAVPPLPRDEIGDLGESFERMRCQLAESMERITRHAQELEDRVAARTRDLAAARDALEAHNEQRGRLLRKVIGAQEEERKRLARELHDETCQKVAALGIRIETALGAGTPDEMRERLGDARALASRTLEDIHRVIFDLRPSVLDDLGLLSAIRWYATRQLEPKGISVRFDFPDAEVHLPPEVETALFRTVQEAINNIARHSQAESALIEIDARPGELLIEVEDDGQGFDVESVSAPSESGRGLGLLGLRERMELLGGSVEVDSSPGDGTRVAFRVRVGQGFSPA